MRATACVTPSIPKELVTLLRRLMAILVSSTHLNTFLGEASRCKYGSSADVFGFGVTQCDTTDPRSQTSSQCDFLQFRHQRVREEWPMATCFAPFGGHVSQPSLAPYKADCSIVEIVLSISDSPGSIKHCLQVQVQAPGAVCAYIENRESSALFPLWFLRFLARLRMIQLEVKFSCLGWYELVLGLRFSWPH